MLQSNQIVIHMRYALLATIKQHILLICTVLIVTACAHSVRGVYSAHRVILDDNIGYVLQPIPENLINTGMQALFQVKQQGLEKQFLMQIEMTSSRLLISAMTIEGLSLFTLDWQMDSGQLSIDKNIAIEPLRLLAELQFVLWPRSEVALGLEQASIATTRVNTREISIAGDILYKISHNGNITHLINIKQDYTLIIKELARWNISVENISAVEE